MDDARAGARATATATAPDDAATVLRERLEQLATMNAIGEVLNQEASFAVAADRALSRLVELLGLQAGWLFVSSVARGEAKAGALSVASCHGLPPALAVDDAAPLREGGCDCQWLFRHGRLDGGVNIVHCSRLEAASGDRAGLEVHASIPLLGRRGPIGIMNLAAPGRERFDEATLAFLTAIGRQLGTAFERSTLLDERTREARYTAALEERQRLAVEMHDSVAQVLFAAELSLQSALADATKGPERVATAAGLVGDALERLRALVEVLRPVDPGAPLDTLLRRLAERLGPALDVAVELPTDAGALDTALDATATVALYRVAQEATHNVLKHASAHHLWLRLDVAPGAVVLTVDDDGVGPPDDAVLEASGGLGLPSLRHRLEQVGGRLSLAARPAGGTTLEATVPWRA
jgi:two-component system, NarL family, sensor kinase